MDRVEPMTTCAQCLSEMSSMRMVDMRAGSAVAQHCETCPDCSTVAHELAYAERRLSTALSDARSSFTIEELSQAAMTGSERERRKGVARWARGLLAGAGCVTFFFFMQNVFIPRVDPPQRISRETIFLHCITPEQAIEIATPYLRSHGSGLSTTGGLKAITLSGQPAEFAQAVNHVKVVDDAQKCQFREALEPNAPAITPAPTTTSSDKPGKD